jgi:hypothetical protein
MRGRREETRNLALMLHEGGVFWGGGLGELSRGQLVGHSKVVPNPHPSHAARGDSIAASEDKGRG